MDLNESLEMQARGLSQLKKRLLLASSSGKGSSPGRATSQEPSPFAPSPIRRSPSPVLSKDFEQEKRRVLQMAMDSLTPKRQTVTAAGFESASARGFAVSPLPPLTPRDGATPPPTAQAAAAASHNRPKLDELVVEVNRMADEMRLLQQEREEQQKEADAQSEMWEQERAHLNKRIAELTSDLLESRATIGGISADRDKLAATVQSFQDAKAKQEGAEQEKLRSLQSEASEREALLHFQESVITQHEAEIDSLKSRAKETEALREQLAMEEKEKKEQKVDLEERSRFRDESSSLLRDIQSAVALLAEKDEPQSSPRREGLPVVKQSIDESLSALQDRMQRLVTRNAELEKTLSTQQECIEVEQRMSKLLLDRIHMTSVKACDLTAEKARCLLTASEHQHEATLLDARLSHHSAELPVSSPHQVAEMHEIYELARSRDLAVARCEELQASQERLTQSHREKLKRVLAQVSRQETELTQLRDQAAAAEALATARGWEVERQKHVLEVICSGETSRQ